MCICRTPHVNGAPHWSGDGLHFSAHPVNPPALSVGDQLIYDLPGRCGMGGDSHAYHLRVVEAQFGGQYWLLVRHGGGDERIRLGYRGGLMEPLVVLDETGRYWFLVGLFHLLTEVRRTATEATNATWRQAAAEERIKVRKGRGQAPVRVEIEPKQTWRAGPR